MLRLVAILLLLPPGLALADVSGPATVIDGDTLDVAGERIRLSGIDAPSRPITRTRSGVSSMGLRLLAPDPTARASRAA